MTLAASKAAPLTKVEHAEGRAAEVGRRGVGDQRRVEPLGGAHVQAPDRGPEANGPDVRGEREGELSSAAIRKTTPQTSRVRRPPLSVVLSNAVAPFCWLMKVCRTRDTAYLPRHFREP